MDLRIEQQNLPISTRKRKHVGTNKGQCLRDIWDNIKSSNICVIRVQGGKKYNGAEKLYEEIMAVNSPNSAKAQTY